MKLRTFSGFLISADRVDAELTDGSFVCVTVQMWRLNCGRGANSERQG